jgi:hypothetical protein
VIGPITDQHNYVIAVGTCHLIGTWRKSPDKFLRGMKPARPPQQRTTLLLQNLNHLFLGAWLFTTLQAFNRW